MYDARELQEGLITPSGVQTAGHSVGVVDSGCFVSFYRIQHERL